VLAVPEVSDPVVPDVVVVVVVGKLVVSLKVLPRPTRARKPTTIATAPKPPMAPHTKPPIPIPRPGGFSAITPNITAKIPKGTEKNQMHIESIERIPSTRAAIPNPFEELVAGGR